MKRIKVFIAITMSLVLFLTGVGNLSVEAVKKSVSAKITFWDVKGNKQKIKKEKVNKKNMGVKLCDEDIGCFVSDNHFYFCPKPETLLYNGENPELFEVCRDKGEKIGSFSRNRENRIINWGKYGEKLYFVLRKRERQVEAENSSARKPTKIMTVDLNTWETKIVDCSKNYREFLTVFVYHNKMYIQDTPTKLDEIDMSGKCLRTISLKKKSNIILQGIVDGKVYYLTWKNKCHVLRKKDLTTGKDKIVLRYVQPPFNKKKENYVGAKFYMMGNKLFILEALLTKSPVPFKKVDSLPDNKICEWDMNNNIVNVCKHDNANLLIQSVITEIAKIKLNNKTNVVDNDLATCISFMCCKRYQIEPQIDVCDALFKKYSTMSDNDIISDLTLAKGVLLDINNEVEQYLEARLKHNRSKEQER